ncbi:NADH:ubiquinone oxidoreductase [Paenibacillus popilliae ATCC 14706]|uniref:NADH:ubiquinone oxidoreductase n=1 Tax=Paenibacillus popilliae ATCC 14706 TaxID=1212764 RepID=M9LB96_PAEPP|nr:NADH:ubiquinone oxidoreductase [Paenibacillus popilliae ATCC 14706]
MITVLYRIGLYVSSFFPLYILIVIGNYNYFTSWLQFWDLIKFKDISTSLFWLIIFILIVISIISLLCITNRSQNEKHQFTGVSKTEDSLLSYVVTYLIPLLSIEITKVNSLLVNAGLFLLLGFIYVRNNFIYLNPLFLFFGYNIFKTANEEVLISNYDIYDLKNMENEKLKCRVLG